jgi:hypothetical protein
VGAGGHFSFLMTASVFSVKSTLGLEEKEGVDQSSGTGEYKQAREV